MVENCGPAGGCPKPGRAETNDLFHESAGQCPGHPAFERVGVPAGLSAAETAARVTRPGCPSTCQGSFSLETKEAFARGGYLGEVN